MESANAPLNTENSQVVSKAPGSGAGALAGLLWGPPTALIIAGLSTHWDKVPTIMGTVFGGVMGIILGRAFGKFERVLSAAIFGATIPVSLVVIDGVRSGRFFTSRAGASFQEPKTLLILAIMLGGGALVGTLLAATARGFKRMSSPSS